VADKVIDKLGEQVGLSAAEAKLEAFSFGFRYCVDLREERSFRSPGGRAISLLFDGIVVGGIPVGTMDFEKNAVMDVRNKIVADLQLIHEMADMMTSWSAQESLAQSLFEMLVYCSLSQINQAELEPFLLS
jgi:hypothetical protein